MPAQLKEKVSGVEHRSEHDPVGHLIRQEKCTLAPPVEWSCSFVCHLHISLDSDDKN